MEEQLKNPTKEEIKRATKELKIEEEKRKLRVVSLAELDSMEIQPAEWFVQDLIPKKSIIILGGKRGSFKSFGVINLSLAVASGNPFLNFFKTERARILYIDEENGIPVLKDRTKKMIDGLGLNSEDISKQIFFISRQNLKFDRLSSSELLESLIIEYKPDIIVVDSLRRVISFDENVAGEISKLFTDTIIPLSEKYGVTWILLHHLRKGMFGRGYVADDMDELRGSSDLSNCADVVLIFDRKKGEADKFILKQAKCRIASEIPAKLIQLDWADDSLKMLCVGDAQETIYADKMVAEMIMTWLSEEQKTAFKTSEALEAMTKGKQSRASVYRALDLLQEGDKPKIRRTKRGAYELNTYTDLNQFKQK